MAKYKKKYKTAKTEIKALKLQIEKLKIKPKPIVSSFTKRNKLNNLHDMLSIFNPTQSDICRCNDLFFNAMNCTELMGKRASSITSTVIYLGLPNVDKHEVCDKCPTTMPTLNGLVKIFRKNNLL